MPRTNKRLFCKYNNCNFSTIYGRGNMNLHETVSHSNFANRVTRNELPKLRSQHSAPSSSAIAPNNSNITNETGRSLVKRSQSTAATRASNGTELKRQRSAPSATSGELTQRKRKIEEVKKQPPFKRSKSTDLSEVKNARPKQKRLQKRTKIEGPSVNEQILSVDSPFPPSPDYFRNLDSALSDEEIACIRSNWFHIRQRFVKFKNIREYNIRLGRHQLTVEWLEQVFRAVRKRENKAFKLNLDFGRILKSKQTGELLYIWPGTGAHQYLVEPITIREEDDIQNLMVRLSNIDEDLTNERPDTTFSLHMVVNLRIVVYPLNDHAKVGNPPPTIPVYMSESRSLLTLIKNQSSGERYNDRKCLWRCLSFHINYPKVRSEIKRSQRAKVIALSQQKVNDVYEQYRRHKKLPVSWDGAVKPEDLFDIEKFFKCPIAVYKWEALIADENNSMAEENSVEEIQEVETLEQTDGSPTLNVYKEAALKAKEAAHPKMNLILYQGHLMYVTKLETLANSFSCENCHQLFNKRSNCNTHRIECTRKGNKNRAIYVGGNFCPTANVWSKLREVGIKFVKEDKFRNFIICFDLESINRLVGDCEQMKKIGQNTTVDRQLTVASVSINSSVPDYDRPVFMRQTTEINEKKLIDQFVEYLLEIQVKSEKLKRDSLEHVFAQLEQKLKDCADTRENSADRRMKLWQTELEKNFKSLKDQLNIFCSRINVYSYNGARFDMLLARGHLMENVLDRNLKINSSIKRHSAQILLNVNDVLCFKDAAALAAPGTSLESFFKMTKVAVPKGQGFPFDYLTDIKKLDDTEIPPYDCWFDTLKQKPLVTQQEYSEIKTLWREEGFKTLADLLEYYNNRDTLSLIPALETLRKFWADFDICMLNDGTSLSGLAMILMYKSMDRADPVIWLPSHKESDIFELTNQAIIGGPAIPFLRYAEREITKVRDGAKNVGCIAGLDANALYLSCIAAPHLVGVPVKWLKKGGIFERQKQSAGRSSLEELEYVTYLQYSTNDDSLRHAFNNGGQKRFGADEEARKRAKDKRDFTANNNQRNYYWADAYSARDGTVYHYNGCYIHHHKECKTGQIAAQKDPQWAQRIWQRDTETHAYFEAIGLKQEYMWGCKWKVERQRPEIKQFLERKINVPLRSKKELTQTELLNYVQNETLAGFLRVDIRTPPRLYEKLKEMSPLYVRKTIRYDDLSETAKEILKDTKRMAPRQCLCGVMNANNIVVHSALLKYYLDLGMNVTAVHEFVQWKEAAVFRKFASMVTDARKKAATDPDLEMFGKVMKCVGNSAFGKTIENKARFQKTVIANERDAGKLVCKREFISLEPIGSARYYEVTLSKRRFIQNTPRYIGSTILQRAKIYPLRLYYDFFDRFFERATFELCYTDTDSLYFALASCSLAQFETTVKSEMKAAYARERNKYLATETTKMDPGIFKLEFEGTGIICLSAKTVCCWNDAKEKISAKGINKSEQLDKYKFKDVLNTQVNYIGENRGFRKIRVVPENAEESTEAFVRYQQKKTALNYFYAKRKLLPGGLRTLPYDY